MQVTRVNKFSFSFYNPTGFYYIFLKNFFILPIFISTNVSVKEILISKS